MAAAKSTEQFRRHGIQARRIVQGQQADGPVPRLLHTGHFSLPAGSLDRPQCAIAGAGRQIDGGPCPLRTRRGAHRMSPTGLLQREKPEHLVWRSIQFRFK
jgi:hypothetical protein